MRNQSWVEAGMPGERRGSSASEVNTDDVTVKYKTKIKKHGG